MRYTDGNDARLGDVVVIDGKYNGVVVASLDTSEFSARCPKEHWGYLATGVLIDTDFGGLVHCPDAENEDIILARRKR